MRKKWAMTNVIAYFCNALDRPPTCWVPPCVFPPPIPPWIEYVSAHIPFKRGGAGAAAVHSVHPEVFMDEPTSLNRGEGLIARWWQVVGGKLWW